MTDSLYKGTGGHNYIQDEDNDVITHQNHIEEIVEEFMKATTVCRHKGLHLDNTCDGTIHVTSDSILNLENAVRTALTTYGDQRAEEGAKAERERIENVIDESQWVTYPSKKALLREISASTPPNTTEHVK